MALGEGKYGAHASQLLADENADGVAVIILNGTRGSGFSLQLRADVREKARALLPAILRTIAGELESDLGRGGG